MKVSNYSHYLLTTNFQDWFSQNCIWLCCLLGSVILLLIIGIILFFKHKKKKTPKKAISKSAYLESLGGEANIVSHLRKGSRIELVLNDYSKIDKEKIKEAGVDGFIQMSNKLILVLKTDAEEVEKTLFGE